MMYRYPFMLAICNLFVLDDHSEWWLIHLSANPWPLLRLMGVSMLPWILSAYAYVCLTDPAGFHIGANK